MKRWIWLVAAVVLAVAVAVQQSTTEEPAAVADGAPVPTVAPGTDILAGVGVIPQRVRDHNYLRAAFGDAWTDDNSAAGGHNGCDTRNDILGRDLQDIAFVSIKRCPQAVKTGVLHDPYTNQTIAFTRGNQVGADVQIDHIVPLALAWDLGAKDWPEPQRVRFANDPANLLAVSGKANQDKGDKQPADWMPPNHAFWCQYAVQYVAVLRGYGLPVDQPSIPVLRDAAGTCPTG
ncbi:MAG: HNH endonuclease family protein [Mycobacterium sp.]